MTSSPAGARISRRAAAIPTPPRRRPWQEIQRGLVGQLGDGMVLEMAVKYQDIARKFGTPRDNH